MRALLILSTLLILSCSTGTTPPKEYWEQTDEEIEAEGRRQHEYEVWGLCEQVYELKGWASWHRGHTHQRGRKNRFDWVKQDNFDNGCYKIWRKVYGR